MQNISSIPVPQALQRHSGGWKPSRNSDEPAGGPRPPEHETVPSPRADSICRSKEAVSFRPPPSF